MTISSARKMRWTGRSIRSGSAFLALVIFLPASLVLPPVVFGLEPGREISQYIRSTWNSDQGLPQNSVQAIAQTSDGFLWFGTQKGLVRFDGVQFTVLTHRKEYGLAGDSVDTLLASRDGSLWIGTEEGLSHWVPESSKAQGSKGLHGSGTFSVFTDKDGLFGNAIYSLFEDRTGTVWVGTDQGLNRIRDGHVERISGDGAPPGVQIVAITADAKGSLWFGTYGGLFELTRTRFRHWSTRDGLPENKVVSVAVGPDGALWAGMFDHRAVEIKNGHVQPLPVPLPWDGVVSMLSDRDGALWIAFQGHGLGRLYRGHLDLFDLAHGLPSKLLEQGALFEDREGSIWAGFLDAGVMQLSNGKVSVFGRPEGLSGDFIGGVLQSRDGSLWFNCFANGLSRLLPDGRVEVWDHRNGLPRHMIRSLAESRDGSLWVGYANGTLARIRRRRISVYRDTRESLLSIQIILEDRAGTLWVGAQRGLFRFENGRFVPSSIRTFVTGIVQSPDGALWITSDGDGVVRLSNGRLHRFTTADGLPSDHGESICADATGDIWAGTIGGGLSRIRDGKIVSWTVDQGLNDTTIGSVVEDDLGNLWLGTDSGIARVSKAELNASVATSGRQIHPVFFGTSDGMRSKETIQGAVPSASKDRYGRLWFGTINGAVTIDPAHIYENTVAPPVWIEVFRRNGQAVALIDGTRLAPGPENIEFAFSAPSFIAPTLMRFRYRLVGFDRDWNSLDSRHSARYTNLPPGKYTLQVQAANSDGHWNLAGASFTFGISTPWTRTPLAFAFYVAALLLLFWAIIALRTRQLVRHQEELNRVVAERTEQLETEKVALEEARRELQIQATHDALTGLFNRAAIVEHLRREFSRASREQRPLGVIIADIDHFKQINDTYGHLAGDEALRQTANRFRDAMRDYDLVGRYGGEEFLILFPGFDPEVTPWRVDQLLDCIRSRPFLLAAGEIRITCSFGVAAFRPGDPPAGVEDLLSRADSALYVAKNSGRNRVSVYSTV